MDSVSRALLITGRTVDLDPNAFGFNNVSGASLSTLITSNTITPTGYDATTTWSVTNGGQGSVNGGAFTSSGTISPGQNFRVRGTSSSSYSTTVQFLVSIGATQSTWSVTTMAQPTEATYTMPGTYSFIVPAGVTSVSVVAVGGGCGGTDTYGGGGGALAYRNNFSVTPGASLTIVVGAGSSGVQDAAPSAGGSSSAIGFTAGGGGLTPGRTGGGVRTGTFNGGGNGGNGWSSWYGAGGGGAGGYSGAGGTGSIYQNATAGTGGGGGGGTGGRIYGNQVPGGSTVYLAGGGGGGVGILGQGTSGAGGIFNNDSTANQNGKGGSGGGNGGTGASLGGGGGQYGGGGGAGSYYENYGPNYDYYGNLYPVSFGEFPGGDGGDGAVRIIWPGNTRLFPSTNTGTM